MSKTIEIRGQYVYNQAWRAKWNGMNIKLSYKCKIKLNRIHTQGGSEEMDPEEKWNV